MYKYNIMIKMPEKGQHTCLKDKAVSDQSPRPKSSDFPLALR